MMQYNAALPLSYVLGSENENKGNEWPPISLRSSRALTHDINRDEVHELKAHIRLMGTIVSMRVGAAPITPIRASPNRKSKLSNHRCGAMRKIRIPLYHFSPSRPFPRPGIPVANSHTRVYPPRINRPRYTRF